MKSQARCQNLGQRHRDLPSLSGAWIISHQPNTVQVTRLREGKGMTQTRHSPSGHELTQYSEGPSDLPKVTGMVTGMARQTCLLVHAHGHFLYRLGFSPLNHGMKPGPKQCGRTASPSSLQAPRAQSPHFYSPSVLKDTS